MFSRIINLGNADKTSFLLIIAKIFNFLFITTAVFYSFTNLNLSVEILKASSLAGLLLIIIGPISHWLATFKIYFQLIIFNIAIVFIYFLFINNLQLVEVIFLSILLNQVLKTSLDTIFINLNLIKIRSIGGISLDFLRILLLLSAYDNPVIFIVPLILDLLLLIFFSKHYIFNKSFRNLRKIHSKIKLTSFLWVISQRVSIMMIFFNIDKIQNAEIYAYCILLSTQLSGFLETFFSPHWFKSIKDLTNQSESYATGIIRVIEIAYVFIVIFIVIGAFVGSFNINIFNKDIDLISIFILTSIIFCSRFSTLNINHLALYSQKKSSMLITFLINLFLFIFMFFMKEIPWYMFGTTFLATSVVMYNFRNRVFYFKMN